MANKILIPTPSIDEVEKYLKKWDSLENYVLQENSLNKLFYELVPNNKCMEDVLIKASTLNDFYSTNIFSIFPVAKHILNLDIDENNNEVIKNFGQLARRCRKYNTNLILSSQCISDFLGNASVLRHATAIFNNCQYTMVGMLKEDDLKAYLELFKNNPLTDTQIDFLLGAKRGEFLLSIDNKTRIGIKIEATATERRMMGEEE